MSSLFGAIYNAWLHNYSPQYGKQAVIKLNLHSVWKMLKVQLWGLIFSEYHSVPIHVTFKQINKIEVNKRGS